MQCQFTVKWITLLHFTSISHLSNSGRDLNLLFWLRNWLKFSLPPYGADKLWCLLKPIPIELDDDEAEPEAKRARTDGAVWELVVSGCWSLLAIGNAICVPHLCWACGPSPQGDGRQGEV